MAEGSTGEGLHDKSLGSSLSSGDISKSNPPTLAAGGGGKSPSIKTKKSKKTSLFKKLAPHDEFARSSGRGKRKSGREKKSEQKLDSREHLDDVQQDEVPSSLQPAETSYQYDTQEVEQKGTIDVKRIQKANKEILRQNTQLAKLVENLKKEKELLVSERVKLKSENKSLEKELKKSSTRDHRLTKKTSQPQFDDDVDILREKIQILEDQLTERDHIASLLKLRLDKSQLEVSEEPEDMEKSSSSIVKNGSVLDSSAALEMLLEEHDMSLRLRRENEELKSRLTSMEAEAEGFKGQRDLLSASPKNARKRSSGFFKRGKKNNSSGTLKTEEAQQVREDLVRSQSPDVLVPSDSQLDVSISPLHVQKDSTTSLPNYNNSGSSPNPSPHTPTKNRAHAEIVTLQSCLRIAIEEKKTCNECIALLEKELDGTKSKIVELEGAISAAAEKSSMESEKLKSDLKAARLERDTFCGELKIVQQEVDELVEKNEKMDKMYTVSLGEKNKRIQELEQQVEALKKSSPTYNKPPAHAGVSAATKKQVSPARERVLSPPHQSKETSSGKTRSELTESSVVKSKQETKPLEEKKEPKPEKVRERLPSADSLRHEKPEKIGRLFKEKSQEKLMKVVPPSPTRRTVGRLSRESSIDRFENLPVKELKKESVINSPSLTHSPKVAATRAMFEQKIDETKTDQRKSSIVIEQRRRSSVSTTSVNTGTKGTSQPTHSKSYSCDFSSKQVTIQKASGPSTGNVNRSKVVAPTPAMEQVNDPRAQSNEAKNKINSSQHQQQDKPPTPVAAARKQIKSSESVAKVSRITVTSVASPTSSPILSTRKDTAASLSRGGDQPSSSSSSSSSAMLLRHPTSPSLGTSNRQSSSQTRISTVSTTVRHSSPIKAATVGEIATPSKSVHSPVAKSRTESRIQPPMNRSSGLWSNNASVGTSTANTTTTAASAIPTPSNRVVVKTSSRLGDNLLSPVNKSGSLQNIPAQFSDGTTSTQNESSSSSSVSASSNSSGIRRGPTHKAMLRRERKDRPKTMYATRAETSNLVGLISRFQEAEKEKKMKEPITNGVPSQGPTSSMSSVKMNGSTTPVKSGGVSFSPSAIPTAVPMRQGSTPKERLGRPTSYCATNSISNSDSGLHFHSPASSYISSKPPPRERMMQRSKTVAGGLGSAKLSKKAMLLKWCQIITQDYENVDICNFSESFSNGLAFCAMMHHFIPDQIHFNTLSPTNRERNFTLAFQAAEGVGIPSLLDVEDMVSLPKPDWMSVMTYVSFIYNKFGQQQQQQSSMV